MSYSGSESDADAPAVLSLADTAQSARRTDHTLQATFEAARATTRARNRLRDERLKAQAAARGLGRGGEGYSRTQKGKGRKEEGEEGAGSEEESQRLRARMARAMEEADLESNEDSGDEEFVGARLAMDGEGGSEEDESAGESANRDEDEDGGDDKGSDEVSGDEGKRMDYNVGESNEQDDDEDEDTLMGTALDPHSKYLPDEFFTAAATSLSSKPSSLPKRLALSKKVQQAKKNRRRTKDIIVGCVWHFFNSFPFNLYLHSYSVTTCRGTYAHADILSQRTYNSHSQCRYRRHRAHTSRTCTALQRTSPRFHGKGTSRTRMGAQSEFVFLFSIRNGTRSLTSGTW